MPSVMQQTSETGRDKPKKMRQLPTSWIESMIESIELNVMPLDFVPQSPSSLSSLSSS
jgi:hypothetical protein